MNENNPFEISINDFSYDLPEEKIALYPLAERDQSKLLFWNKGEITDRRFRELPELLQGDLLVTNNTRVIEARLFFRTETGALVEIFLLEPHLRTDPLIALSTTGSALWNCLVGRAAKWKSESIHLEKDKRELAARIVNRKEGIFTIEFSWSPKEVTFAEILHTFGNIPLPPYLKRSTEIEDLSRYQTIYAVKEGSVAAPTAGLHFTANIQQELEIKNIRSAQLTLHVGAGTFKPVSAKTLSGHIMHSELIDVPVSLIQLLASQDPDNTIAVGTTSLRSLESLYWLAEILRQEPALSIDAIEIDQWYPYKHPANRTYNEQMVFLAQVADERQLNRFVFRSCLLIAPGYILRSCGGLITNFHQPGSTLLLLVAAITGNDWKKMYAHALTHEYRFLSYGDSSYLNFRKT